ncbi:MAG: LysR family transcriptional regulator [Betaproteobacteria bacterium]|nr:LysR family transcriptional regulator [Betaproteobacteria bacterium]
MDRFQEMRTFVAVAEAGSFVRATETLNLSKTAVSRLVSDLEARLGARLLHRTTRKLSLTPEGELFLERCRQLLDGVAQAEAELSVHAGEAIGLLRINVPVTFGVLHLAPLWPRFMALHPRVTLDMTLSDRVVDLVEEGYDLTVRISKLRASSLVSRQLTTTRLVLCASPQYLQKYGMPGHPSEIANHRVIAYSLLSTGDQWAFDGPEGPVTVKVTPRMITNSGDTCCAAALQHQGIVLQPTFLVGPHLVSGALVEVLPQFRAVELGVYAIFPTRTHLTPKVRALIDFLIEAFGTRSWPA